MSFAGILQGILDDCRGARAIALMGSDGLPIEQVVARAGSVDPSGDIAAAGVEFGRILEEVRKAADSLEAGAPKECVFVLTRFTVIVHSVDRETFVALALGPDGNLGKARYLIRRDLRKIRDEL